MSIRFGLWCTKRPSDRAVTLPEVLVAIAVFSLVLLMVVAIQSSGLEATRKQQAHEDTFRSAMLAAEHLKRELPGAMVDLGTVGPRLTYRVPRMDEEGRPFLGPTGEVLWSDPVVIELDSRGYLTRAQGEEVRRLSYLGPTGEVTFRITPGRLDELQVSLTARHAEGTQSSSYRLDLRFRLANQR